MSVIVKNLFFSLFSRLSLPVAVLLGAVVLSSCGSKEEPEPVIDEPEVVEEPVEVVEEVVEPVVIEEPMEPGECIPNCNLPREALYDPDGNLADRTVNFEFDKSDLNEADQITLRYHAEYLTSWPDVQIKIVGHADERGSREYNLALGHRRADSVKTYLESLGVSWNQLNTDSRGEDEPIATGSNEFSWAQNRRAELGYE